MAWRPGTMGAEAIVDIVYGRINPFQSKLSVSIPWCIRTGAYKLLGCKTGHILTEDNSNRFTSRYMDIPNTPLYPFGYGLSYTEFDISDIDVQTGQDKKYMYICNVCAIRGMLRGAEVVNYYETLYAPVVRRRKSYPFRKVFLEPGRRRMISVLTRKILILKHGNRQQRNETAYRYWKQ